MMMMGYASAGTLYQGERVSPKARGEGLRRLPSPDSRRSIPSSGCFAATFSPWEKGSRVAVERAFA